MNKAPKSFKTVKEFNVALATFKKAATSQRQRLHELLCAGLDFVEKDWNAQPLSSLIKVVQELRHFNSKAVMTWLYFGTGGAVSQDVGSAVLPKNSVLRFDSDKCVFSIAPLHAGKKSNVSDEERAALQEERVKMLSSAIAHAKNIPFWMFAPEKVQSPYTLAGLLFALKKAEDNQEHLTEADRTFVRDLLRTCDVHNKELRKGNKDSDKKNPAVDVIVRSQNKLGVAI